LALGAAGQYTEFFDAQQAIVKAYELELKEQLDEAYDLYASIPENDTNHPIALMQQISIRNRQERFTEMLELVDQGIELRDKYLSDFYIEKGVALISLERYEDAIAFYTEAMKEFPQNHVLLYNTALCYKLREDYPRFLVEMKKVVAMYPYYGNAHLELGTFAYREGKIAQSLMAYLMYLLVEPTGEKSNELLAVLNNVVTRKIESEPTGTKLSPKGDDFSDIDLIISNYAALQKGYKLKTKADLPLIRQVQVMLETLEYDPEDEGFWMQQYAKLYKKIWDENMFEGFSYFLIASSEVPKHKSLVSRKKASMDRFVTWSADLVNEQYHFVDREVDGRTERVQRWFYTGEDQGLLAIGNYEASGQVGCWETYHTSGALSSKGCYDAQGVGYGKWQHFDEIGRLQRQYTLKDNKFDGLFQVFDIRGNVDKEADYKAGKLDGEYRE
ncbi:MAG: hypothetical protein AAGB22_05555, partial [Bacteroidota bacterium]